jgi:hypothetical protein
MNFSFQASSRTSSDWMLLKMLRDPSKKWRVDLYGQSMGEEGWLPLFSKVVGLSDAPLPLKPPAIPNALMRVLERVDGRWL